MRCGICGRTVNMTDPTSVRLSSTSPPWTVRYGITSLARSFSETLRLMTGKQEETYWFHGKCWEGFRSLLS